MADKIEAHIIGKGYFEGPSWNEFLKHPLFQPGILKQMGAISAIEDDVLGNPLKPDEVKIHFIEHPYLGTFTAHIWQMSGVNKKMKMDRHMRGVGGVTCGILVKGRQVVPLTNEQREQIDAQARPIFEAEWRRCDEASRAGQGYGLAVEAKALPAVQLEIMPESDLKLLPGKHFSRRPEMDPNLRPEDIQRYVAKSSDIRNR